MGTRKQLVAMADNSWAVGALESTIAPLAIGGGIYDFSGTVPNHVYAELPGTDVSKDMVANYAKTWWDGSSPSWSSDDDFAELCKKGHKLAAGEENKGIIVAHADYTCIVGVFDQEKQKPAGPLAMAV